MGQRRTERGRRDVEAVSGIRTAAKDRDLPGVIMGIPRRTLTRVEVILAVAVELIGAEEPLAFEQRADGLSVMVPQPTSGSVLPVLRITPADRIPNARKYELRN